MKSLKEQAKKYIYQIVHDYDVRAMFFVFNSLIINFVFMITYLILYLCNLKDGLWYGELVVYYFMLIVGYGIIFYKYKKWKNLTPEQHLLEERKLFLPLGIVIFFLAIIIFTLTSLLYHYDLETNLPMSLIYIHGSYVVVRLVVSLILLIKKRKYKMKEHTLSFIAKHFSYIGVLMSFVLTTNAFKLISNERNWEKAILLRGEVFGILVLIFGIIFIVKGIKAYKK